MLKQKIQDAFIQAMKAKDEVTRDTLKMVRSAIRNAEIDGRRELSEEEIIKILRSEVKKREEAIVLYKQGNRPDLVEKETVETQIIQKFLPPEMDQGVLEAIVSQVIVELGTGAVFGAVMQAVLKQVSGQVDGKRVSETVRAKLA